LNDAERDEGPQRVAEPNIRKSMPTPPVDRLDAVFLEDGQVRLNAGRESLELGLADLDGHGPTATQRARVMRPSALRHPRVVGRLDFDIGEERDLDRAAGRTYIEGRRRTPLPKRTNSGARFADVAARQSGRELAESRAGY
jgi:hypothetical protein